MEFKLISHMSAIFLIWIMATASIFGLDHPVERQQIRNYSDLMMTASTNGAQSVNQQKSRIEDDKKTLSQQVAEGKYGLIQKELFIRPIKRPGVLSYDSNNEVPKDTINNFGGLNKSEIWLAENHLLVIKGGIYPLLESLPEYSQPTWPPIDDYDAPRRQVKIPKHPKVPPPFPVQLTDGGPIQILGTNSSRTLNDSFFQPYALSPLEGYDPGTGPYFPPEYPYSPNATSGEAPLGVPPYPEDKTSDGASPQFPIHVNGGIPPFFDSLPPGSAILPPPNITDQYDEDDLSIYYPPPYSFYYPKDNTTQVPPGPLVPGIVLPPPLDFFGVLTQPTTTPKSTTTTKSPKINNTTSRTKPVYYTTTLKPIIIKPYEPPRNKTSVTVLRPIKPTKKPSPTYIYDNTLSNNPFNEYGPPTKPKHQGRITISTTKVPLRAYFTTKDPKHKQGTQIYIYDNSISTPGNYLNLTQNYYTTVGKQDSRRYNNNPFVQVQEVPLQHYFYIPNKQYITQRPKQRIIQQTFAPNNFKSHLAKLQEQIRSYQRPKEYQENVYQTRGVPIQPSPKPVYQYSFEVANYQEQHDKLQGPEQFKQVPKYTVEIEPAVEITTTQSPIYQNTHAPIYYQEDTTQKYYNYQQERQKYSAVTPQPQPLKVTQNPIYDTYYTHHDQQLFDDITMKYFTTFGKKLPTSTTPIPTVEAPNRQLVFASPPDHRPFIPSQEIKDNIVYVNRAPNSQYVPQPYPQVRKQIPQYVQSPQIYQHPIQSDNYQNRLPQPLQAINIPTRSTLGGARPGSFISYELPGDNGAHFYFLTPQLTRKEDRSNIAYYYTDSNSRTRQ